MQYLNNKAEYLEDLIEAIPEISGIEIRGVQDRKLKIEVNKFKAEAAKVSFQDIETRDITHVRYLLKGFLPDLWGQMLAF